MHGLNTMCLFVTLHSCVEIVLAFYFILFLLRLREVALARFRWALERNLVRVLIQSQVYLDFLWISHLADPGQITSPF